MRKRIRTYVAILSIMLVFTLLQGCGASGHEQEDKEGEQTLQTQLEHGSTMPDPAASAERSSTDSGGTGADGKTLTSDELKTLQINETGRIMVVMFHKFVETYTEGDKAYTTTFGEFETLLGTLYGKGYRLISLSQYLTGDIDTPAGCIPIVFTFDDGTAGQFSLIEKNGKLELNPKSAVGIMEKFNQSHPDFGAKGTFFITLGQQTFPGAGTVQERLQYLTGEGFELGNHTYSHINLKEATSGSEIQKEIGRNQKELSGLISGYTFKAFSLPYGEPAGDLAKYVEEGDYEGLHYNNAAIMEVGWDPAPSPFSVKFAPLTTHRVRASGITPVDADLAWWLKELKTDKQFISDGDRDTVTVPESMKEYVNTSMLGDRTIVTY